MPCRSISNFLFRLTLVAPNQQDLQNYVDLVILPRKGKNSEKEKEYFEEFVKNRYKHSTAESAINALEVHGLDMCHDHGIDGFKRYVALAVLGRNIQQLSVKRDDSVLKQKDESSI